MNAEEWGIDAARAEQDSIDHLTIAVAKLAALLARPNMDNDAWRTMVRIQLVTIGQYKEEF